MLSCYPTLRALSDASSRQPSTSTKRSARRWIWTLHPLLLDLSSNRQAQALFVSRLAASVSLYVPGGTPELFLLHSSYPITDPLTWSITDPPLTWSILAFRNPTHLVCFTFSLAGALGVHPEVGVHVVGADARMGVSDGWQP